MEKPRAESGSERPDSHRVTSANATAANETVGSQRQSGTGNGTGAGDVSHGDIAIEDGAPQRRRPWQVTGTQLVLVATLWLALIAWLIVLVAQAVVASTINNAAVRVLWFGFLVQTVVIGLVLAERSFDPGDSNGTQIAVFGAIATVFAVLGVDGNIYSSRAAQQATGAGWLITAIVDLIWITIFTARPSSPIFNAANYVSRRNGSANSATKIPRSSGAFSMGRLHGGNARMSQGPSVPVNKRETIVESEAGGPDAKVSPGDKSSSYTDADAKGRALALFDYEASPQDTHELSFKQGEILLIFNTDSKWWEAKTPNGKQGIAPSNYLKLIE